MATPERGEPRVMLALIALAGDLPVPMAIRIYPEHGILSLSFERVASGQVWSEHLGGRTDTRVHDGRRWLDEGSIDWRGWNVRLAASEPVAAESAGAPLEPGVVESLSVLVPPAQAAA